MWAELSTETRAPSTLEAQSFKNNLVSILVMIIVENRRRKENF